MAPNLLLPLQFTPLWGPLGEGSALLSTGFHPPSCFGVGLEGFSEGLSDPAALGSVSAPVAAGGQELRGQVDTQKGFKT